LLLIGIFLCVQGYTGRVTTKGQVHSHSIQSMLIVKKAQVNVERL